LTKKDEHGSICEDIDECSNDPCHGSAVCENTLGSFQCKCKSGFDGDGFECVDTNECETVGLCGENGKCINFDGGFSCECISGFRKENDECVNIDECAQPVSSCGINTDCQESVINQIYLIQFEGIINFQRNY
jgi:hypothetical protein